MFLDLLFAVNHLHPVLPHLGPLVAPPRGERTPLLLPLSLDSSASRPPLEATDLFRDITWADIPESERRSWVKQRSRTPSMLRDPDRYKTAPVGAPTGSKKNLFMQGNHQKPGKKHLKSLFIPENTDAPSSDTPPPMWKAISVYFHAASDLLEVMVAPAELGHFQETERRQGEVPVPPGSGGPSPCFHPRGRRRKRWERDGD